ncbi:tripartite tricarboxylate transporter TctB family protein [Rhizobacter sp. J219]|uniref:tripartite tricarboxylate transporter TctB family protein n=1 Tax=Rhizobacter sp. J219 TaxID=2898430 RepID=UPI0021509657|nr:tripartite tricarboxylate transporter TctB family protein [Rhizobacter sp. J219]MCR5883180.1 tripartite tricarboxylate transporter TctB family protein [Rhizobacter sp. J219]
MKIKSEKDFWSGIMFLVVGIVFAVGATNYSMGTSARPGPGYFPLILSIILAILGAIVLFKSLTIETEGGDKIGHIAWRPLLVVVASIAMFAVLLPRLGMFLTIPVLIVMVSFAGDEFKWKGVLIAAVVLTIFSWLVFVKGLGLTIPVLPSFIAN